MGASLVSLFRPRGGWTNEERAQFARIERLLADAGFAVDVEHGESDEGDPWCVFCSRATGDVIIHVARIDGRVMFDSSALPRPIEGMSFDRCAERFFEDVALPMPLERRRGQVYLHPSAMLASLFITILLYAHATTEQPLFDEEAIDVDDPDAPGAQGWAALRLKTLAGQVADFVAGTENAQQQHGQGYVNPGLAAIPAGMAMAVIAIAQDLANAQEAGMLPEFAAAPLPGAPEPEEVAVHAEIEQPEGAEDADIVSRIFAEIVALTASARTAAAEAAESEAGSAGAMLPTLDIAAVAEEIAASAGRSIDSIVGVELPAMAVELGRSGGDDRADLPQVMAGEDAPEAASMTFAGLCEDLWADAAAIVDTILFDVAGRVVEFDVVAVSESVAARIEGTLIAAASEGDSLAFLLEGEAPAAGPDAADREPEEHPDALAGDAPARSGRGPDHDAGALAGDAGSASGSGGSADDDGPVRAETQTAGRGVADGPTAPATPVAADPQAPARQPPATPENRVVSVDELDDLLATFARAVGEATVFRSATSEVYLDESLRSYTRSEDITFETVFLDDGTKVTFAGAAWDFDGFL